MSLTIPQKKYLVKRIDEVANQKVSKLKDVESTKAIKIAKDGLEKGEIEIRTRGDIVKIIENSLTKDEYRGWAEYGLGSIDVKDLLIGYEEAVKKHELDRATENAQIVEKRNAIYEEATRIKDQAMFGTEQEAYAMLDKFMEMEI